MIRPMPFKSKQNQKYAYKLIIVCLAAVALGCVLPLLRSLGDVSASNLEIDLMEGVGGAVLLVVFGLYLVKK